MMPTLVIIAQSIPPEAFLLFLQSKNMKPIDTYDGYRGNAHDGVHIKMNPESLTAIREDYPALWQTMCSFFQTEPQTSIIIDLFRTNTSKELALEFVQSMSECWKIILLDEYYTLYSDTMIKTLQHTDMEW